MGLIYSSYYGLARVNNTGPEIKDWAVTDLNFQVISLLFKAMELHKHSASTPIRFPGYNYATPATPIVSTLTEDDSNTGGVLQPGGIVGVRFSYINGIGLETDASPEIAIQLASIPLRADGPSIGAPFSTPVGNAVIGGTYIYGITKIKGVGETQISNIATVDVAFDPTSTTSYVVPLSFDPPNSYTDGTSGIRIYRSTGFNAAFQLVKTLTDPVVTSWNDNNVLEDPNTGPPATNTFDKNKAITINWSGFVHPGDAQKMRMYVTQQPGVYGISNLLAEYATNDPSTPIPSNLTYLGSEVLQEGYPKEFTQIIGGPPKINLAQEAVGAPILTTDMDFNGYMANHFVFGNQLTSTPINGNVYVDNSTNQLKVRLGGNYVTLATPNSSYVHSTLEPGGHSTSNILYPTQGGTTARSVLDVIATPVGSPSGGVVRRQVQSITKVLPTTANYQYSGALATPIPEVTSGVVLPDFNGQWVEVTMNLGTFIDPKAASATASFQMEVDGTLTAGAETVRSETVFATPTHTQVILTYATPIGIWGCVFRGFWWTSGGTITSVGPRRTLIVKELF